LDEPQLLTNIPAEQTNSMMSVLLLILVFIILGGVCVELVFRFFYKNDRHKIVLPEAIEAFSEEVVVVPMGLYFDKSHSWAFRRKDGTIRVGIDDFLQHLTGKITKVEMKEPGIKIRKGDHLCSIIRKGKVLHIYSPITGTILEVNEKLKSNSVLLNSGPYSDGWIYVIEPVNWELELQYLTVAERFKANLKDEFQRFKDFMDSAIKSISPDFACSILQDGGSFVDHPLAELGPDVWDDFQTKFIDAAK
jgi:glycine cleavage system H lipoate-binding protein